MKLPYSPADVLTAAGLVVIVVALVCMAYERMNANLMEVFQ